VLIAAPLALRTAPRSASIGSPDLRRRRSHRVHYHGGAANGEGTVFSITTSGTATLRHSFGPYFSGDGERPYGDLVNVKGTLYGTTGRGGNYTYGAIFKITRSGKESVLHSFGGSGYGEEPYAGLANVKGTLYGTTSSGGGNGDGTVFGLSP
jgi:uncharacterized repeat protein (TIGR03803 family)